MPAGGNNDDIVVVGRFGFDVSLNWGVLPGFSGLAAYNLPLGTFGSIAANSNGDIVVTATARTPKIVLSHMTLEQELRILSMIDHVSNYPKLQQALQKAHDANATLVFNYKDELDPSGHHATGNITFTPVLNYFDPAAEYDFQPGSTITIDIFGKELGTQGPDSSFDFTVGHELGHLTIDPLTHNSLIDDYGGRNPGQTYAQDVDNAIVDAIASRNNLNDYSDSKDFKTSNIENYGTSYFGTSGITISMIRAGFQGRTVIVKYIREVARVSFSPEPEPT